MLAADTARRAADKARADKAFNMIMGDELKYLADRRK